MTTSSVLKINTQLQYVGLARPTYTVQHIILKQAACLYVLLLISIIPLTMWITRVTHNSR